MNNKTIVQPQPRLGLFTFSAPEYPFGHEEESWMCTFNYKGMLCSKVANRYMCLFPFRLIKMTSDSKFSS
jgi:hypothetical protein